jgi:hypothetical protein
MDVMHAQRRGSYAGNGMIPLTHDQFVAVFADYNVAVRRVFFSRIHAAATVFAAFFVAQARSLRGCRVSPAARMKARAFAHARRRRLDAGRVFGAAARPVPARAAPRSR